MVFLGDYIDRGPKVIETIDTLITLKAEFPNTVFLKGNHEDMFIRFLLGDASRDEDRMFVMNGGDATLQQYYRTFNMECDSQFDIGWDDLPTSHANFYSDLVVSHEDGDFIFVHAGLWPDAPMDKQLDHNMMWVRNKFLKKFNPWLPGKIIVHGHTPMEPREIDTYNKRYGWKINIDSGCCFGYHLTCVDVHTKGKFTVRVLDNVSNVC